MQRSFMVALLATTLVLAGCASSRPKALSVSITELGTESRMDAGSWTGDLRHRQSYNIAGTGAIDSIGMLSSDPDPSPLPDMWKSWFRQELLPDQLALRLTPGCSRVYLRDFHAQGSEATAEQVIAVRDGLQDVQSKVVDLVAAETNQQLLGTLAETEKELAALKQSPDPNREAVLAKRREALAAWLSAAGFGAIPEGDLSSLIQAADKKIDELRKELSQAEQAFARARRVPGIIVARWKIADGSSQRVDAIGASVERSSQEDGSGFVVLGSPRVATLAAGDDLVLRACSLEDVHCKGNRPGNGSVRSGIESMVPPKRMYVTTYQLLARHAAWTDARSLRRIQSLALSMNKLIEGLSAVQGAANLVGRLKSLQLNLVRTSASALDAENMGALSAGRLKTLDISFATDALMRRSVERVLEENQQFLVISSMRSTLDGHVLRGSGAGTTWPKDDSCARPSWASQAPGSTPAQTAVAH